MQTWKNYFAGVEDVWCLLAINVFLLVFVTSRLIQAWPSKRMVSIARDETGGTYMLPLVLTMPFYVLLITMIVECTLLLTAKIGSVGAAYAAARSAAVWLPYENAMPKDAPDYTPLENRQTMVRLAAARAMFPYASGSTSHATDTPPDELVDATANQQIAVFQAYSGDQNFDGEYLKRKFAYAYNATTIEIVYLDPDSLEPYERCPERKLSAEVYASILHRQRKELYEDNRFQSPYDWGPFTLSTTNLPGGLE